MLIIQCNVNVSGQSVGRGRLVEVLSLPSQPASVHSEARTDQEWNQSCEHVLLLNFSQRWITHCNLITEKQISDLCLLLRLASHASSDGQPHQSVQLL